jgi:hypothetical protein
MSPPRIASVMKIRSVSFDTSFLLRDSFLVDSVIKTLAHDSIPCFITTTVVSELEQLKIWGRIFESDYKLAIKRWKKSHATVIDFKNRLGEMLGLPSEIDFTLKYVSNSLYFEKSFVVFNSALHLHQVSSGFCR